MKAEVVAADVLALVALLDGVRHPAHRAHRTGRRVAATPPTLRSTART